MVVLGESLSWGVLKSEEVTERGTTVYTLTQFYST